MFSYCNTYLKLVLLTILFSIPVRMASQIVVLDTTMELSYPLQLGVQEDLNNYLMLAASAGQVPAINWLIKHGAEVDAKTDENATPLMLAVANNNTEAVLVLLQYKPDVNIMTLYSETPLLAAAKNGNVDVAEALIRDSADINFADRYGATPLHYASIFGYFYLTDMLLYYQADKELKSEDGTTPLMAAIWAGFADITDLLIQEGANCEVKDKQGFTPLMIAAQNGDTVIMELLLKKQVNMYKINNYKYDALDILIKSNYNEAIQFLLRRGYKWSSRLPEASDPYSLAVKNGRKGTIQVLEKNNVPENHSFGFNQVTFSASIKFCSHDYFTGANLAFKEPHLNGGLIVGFDFKPGYTRVLDKVDDNLFYQYQDKSSVAYGGIFKDLRITDHPFMGNWFFNSSLVAAYSFGNKLKGTNISPGNIFKIIPSAGIKWAGANLSFYGNLDYMRTIFYKIGPVWLRLGISYNMFFDKDRARPKNIKWY
jgi:ankyrin repeat protein